MQILEIVFSVAGNNSTTRWKEAIGVPQEPDATRFQAILGEPPNPDRPLPLKNMVTPTSDKYQQRRSILAPTVNLVTEDEGLLSSRPRLEPREQTEQALAKCQTRSPRLPLVKESQARALLGEGSSGESLPQWVRLLANFPRDGKARILSLQAAEEKGGLAPLLKAQVSWIAARVDRAWYALGLAKAKLHGCGWSDNEIYKLDGPWDDFSPREQAAFAFARKLTAAPELLCDDDVAQVRKQLGDRDTVQLIKFLANKAFFHRVTEAAGLQIEP